MNYSQNNEDEFLAEYFGDKHDGFFVDIGANDGIKGSNTRRLWELGWSGVLVEGCYHTFTKLLSNYSGAPRVRFVFAAVCSIPGAVTFYEDVKTAESGWNSMNEKWIRMFPDGQFAPSLAPTVTISQLGLPDTFDFLSVDAEGNDAEILTAMPEKMRPRLIMAEVDKFDNRSVIDAFLTGRGYRKVFSDKTNANAAYSL